MENKSFIRRFKVLSKPTGRPQWKKAVKAIFLMIVALAVAKFLGFDAGLEAIIFITLIAAIIIDLPLPLRKIIPIALVGLLMTTLAFISSSLALSSLPIFIFFAVVWSFFSLSMYIFGGTSGAVGFIIFMGYFISVILVNREASPLEWGSYIVLAYLVASILFIPKILGRKKDISNMVASPYMPETSLEQVLSIRQALSGVPLTRRDYELFRIGTYLTGFRGFSKLLISRLSRESQEIFQKFMKNANASSSQLAAHITSKSTPFTLESVNKDIKNMEKKSDTAESTMKSVLDVAYDIRSLLAKANDLLAIEDSSKERMKISSPHTSLKDVLEANFNLNNMYIRHALRFTLAMTIGLLVVYLTHNRDAIWITMGILIIIKPDVTSTINNMILRVSFNVVAIILAIILALIFPHEILFWIAFLMLFLFRAFYPGYMGLSVMALTVFVVFVWPTGTVFENAWARLIDITIGALIAFVCAYLILPSRLQVNLPQQIAKTIRANREYAENVIPSEDYEYEHEKAVKSFRKYMLEEKNLESAIKKVEDTFDDVSDDVLIYRGIKATNRKLSADLSALGTLLMKNEFDSDLSRLKEDIVNALNEMSLSVEKDVILPKARLDSLNLIKNDLPEDVPDYLNWIISDIEYLQEEVEVASRSGALKRYRNLI